MYLSKKDAFLSRANTCIYMPMYMYINIICDFVIIRKVFSENFMNILIIFLKGQ